MKFLYVILFVVNFLVAQELNLYLETNDNDKKIELDIELIENNISGFYHYQGEKNDTKIIKGFRDNGEYYIKEFNYKGEKVALITLKKINPFTFVGRRVELKSLKKENLKLYKDIYIKNSIGEEYANYLITFKDSINSKIVTLSIVDEHPKKEEINNFFLKKIGFNSDRVEAIYKLKYFDIKREIYEFEGAKPKYNIPLSYEFLNIILINDKIVTYSDEITNLKTKQKKRIIKTITINGFKTFRVENILVKHYKKIIKKYINRYRKKSKIDKPFDINKFDNSKNIIFSNHEAIVVYNNREIYIPYYEILDLNNSFLKTTVAFDK